MSAVEKRYYLLEALYALALSYTKATYVLFFLSQGLSHAETSLLFGTFSLTVIFSEPLTAPYAELFGRKRSFLLGCALKVGAACGFLWGTEIHHFLLAEVLSGIAVTFISGSLMAWAVDHLNDESPKKALYEIFNRANKFKYAALISGGFLGASLGHLSLRLPWVLNAGSFGLLFILAWVLLSDKRWSYGPGPGPSPSPSPSPSPGHLSRKRDWKRIWKGYGIVIRNPVLSGLVFTGFFTEFSLVIITLFFIPAVKPILSGSMLTIAWLWVAISLFHLLGTFFVGPFVKRFQTKLDSLILFSVISTVFLILMVATLRSPWTILFYLLFEFGKPLFTSVKDDLINSQIDEDCRVTVLSFYNVAIKLGASLGLVFFGKLSDLWGMQTAWYIAAVFFMANLLFYYLLRGLLLKPRAPVSQPVLGL